MANTFIFDDDQPQSDPGSSGFDSSDPEQPEGGEGNNRTFLIVAVILGGIVLLSFVCMAIYVLTIMPGQQASAKQTSDANAVANTQAAVMQQMTQEAASFTLTPPPSETPIPEPTETLVVVFASATPSTVATTDPATATVEALQTQLALVQAGATSTQAGITGTPGTPGAAGTPGKQQLARTGFADEVGLPGLFFAAILLVAVIMLARRLRRQAPQER
jgi:uncharacterized membrane protein YeiB